jgi:histidyl-tRNA synthetase
VAYCAYGPAAKHLRIDPYLARGLSYYTGPIFEIEFPGLSGSGGGGGRYDDLIGIFSGQRIPASGFSMGLERILLLMEERGMFPERLEGQPQVLVTQFDASTAGASFALAHRLRAAGLRVDLYPEPDAYGKQFKYAEQRQIRYALLLSPREVEAGVVAVRDLMSREQEDVGLEQVAAWIGTRI